MAKLLLTADIYARARFPCDLLTLNPNVQLASQVVQASMVLSALTTEVFFKCFVCIDTTLTPQGHYLFELFEQLKLKPETQSKIIHLWDTQIIRSP